MKISFLRFIVLLAVVMSATFSASAYDFIYENLLYSYMTDKSKLAVVGRSDRSEPIVNLVIPSTITVSGKALTVAAIYPEAFSNDEYLETAKIPGTVTTIKDYAFKDCAKLKSVTMEEGLESIGSHSFSGCPLLTELKIPNSVATIEPYAFRNCVGLASVSLPNSLTKIERSTFNGCKSLRSITIPDKVASIGISAFEGCTNMVMVKMPKALTEIGNYAFKSCTKLAEVQCGEGLSSVGTNVFSGCDSIVNLSLKWTTPPTGFPDMFTENEHLKTNVYVPYGSTEAYKKVEPWSKFLRFYEATEINGIYYTLYDTDHTATVRGYVQDNHDVVVPSKVTANGNDYSVTYVYQAAFASNRNLTSVVLPESVDKLDSFTFSSCPKLHTAILKCNLKTLGWGMFEMSRNLKHVELPATLESVKSEIFSFCFGLQSVTFPNGVKTMGTYIFRECEALESVTLSDSLTAIEDGTFFGCENLSSIELPNSVTELKKKSFDGCTSLATLTIGTGLNSVAIDALASCKNITTVNVGWTDVPPAFGDIFHANVFANATLCVPYGTSNKYKQVNPWSKFQKFEENAPTGIGTIENAADEANMVCDIYALSGVKVATGVYANLMHSGTLPAGIYVARFANGTAKKLIVK